MKPLAFRLRIALLSALISGVVLVGFGGASWYWICRQKLASVDTEIRSLGARHPGWFANRGSYERLNSALEFIFGDEHQDQIILLVKDTRGQTLYTSAGWPKEIDPERLDCSLQDGPQTPVSLTATNRDETSGFPRGVGAGRGQGGWGRGPGAGRGGPP